MSKTEKLAVLSAPLCAEFVTLCHDNGTIAARWSEWAQRVSVEFQEKGELVIGQLYRSSSSTPYSERQAIQDEWNKKRGYARDALAEYGLAIIGSPNSYWDKGKQVAREPAPGKEFRIGKKTASNHKGRKSASDNSASDNTPAAAPGSSSPGSRQLTPMQQRTETVSMLADLVKMVGPVELLSMAYEAVEQAKHELSELADSKLDTKQAASAKQQLARFARLPKTPKVVESHRKTANTK